MFQEKKKTHLHYKQMWLRFTHEKYVLQIQTLLCYAINILITLPWHNQCITFYNNISY